MKPWQNQPQTDGEVYQATYDRLARRYRGLDPAMIRAAWRRYVGTEPTEEIVDGIRSGRKLRFT